MDIYILIAIQFVLFMVITRLQTKVNSETTRLIDILVDRTNHADARMDCHGKDIIRTDRAVMDQRAAFVILEKELDQLASDFDETKEGI